MKKILFWIIVIVAALIVMFFLLGFVLTAISKRSQTQQKFVSGTLSETLPNGPYNGSIIFKQPVWKGKRFDANTQLGMNFIWDGWYYPFLFYKTKGLQDTSLDVIVLDYNQNENPIWLKWIRDEIVEIGPNHYLGKVYVEVIPNHPFVFGFFELKK